MTKQPKNKVLLKEFKTEIRSYLIGVGNTYPPEEKEYRYFMKQLLKLEKKIKY